MRNNMNKKYIYKLYSNVKTFSNFASGDEFSFSLENFSPKISLYKNDNIIVYCEPGNFYLLDVIDVNNSNVKVIKKLDLYCEKFINFYSGISIKELSEIDYNNLLIELLSHYIDLGKISNVEQNDFYGHKNIIYYGAPGTGKSYKVDQIIKKLNPKFFERVTFHPEYDNASFIGGYKPISENSGGKDIINYKFVPQAFASIYSRAWKDLENQYYLVIEEINRGNCAEIFGEIFQLLDRSSNYTVTPSKELKLYLIEEFENNPEHEGIVKGLKLPSNLNILATMNTSDQSLFPMDSAFKRRWEWEYIPIRYAEKNEENNVNTSYNYEIDLGDGTKYKWIEFIDKINNNHIKDNLSLGMDKCIGNYFVKPESGNIIGLKQFINKVIFYLWNDVFKDEDNQVFASNTTYEDFFPIKTSGLRMVKDIFERIELNKINLYSLNEDENNLRHVAEDNEF